MTARLWGIIAGLAVLLGILGGIYGWGRSDGREAQAKETAALVARKNAALREAARALTACSTRFSEIDAATAAAIEAAAGQQHRAEAAAAAAALERNELYARIEAINNARDTSPCRDVRVGVPLR